MKLKRMGAALAGVLLLAVTNVEAQVKIDTVEYFDLPDCTMLSNGKVDVIVTTDIGPRIIAYRFSGKDNVLAERPMTEGAETDWGMWRTLGGHRLWHAPESVPRTYWPDNLPVEVKTLGSDTVVVRPPAEDAVGIQKEMQISLAADTSEVTITHRLTNVGLWPIETAPWAITIVRHGGVQIVPNEPFISHDERKLPARPIVVWNFTDLSDGRIKFGRKFIRVVPDAEKGEPSKIGVLNSRGWSAYQVGDALFVKRYPYVKDAQYPDMGVNHETFTKADFTEMETLAPMAVIQPGATATHVEKWYLFPAIDLSDDDDALEEALKPVLSQTTPLQ